MPDPAPISGGRGQVPEGLNDPRGPDGEAVEISSMPDLHDPYAGADLDRVDRWARENFALIQSSIGLDLMALSIDLFDPVFTGTAVGMGEPVARMLNVLFDNRCLPLETAALAVWAWSYSQYPLSALPETRWRQLFRVAGFVRGWDPARRPAETLMLYRGATDDHRLGWSWTGRLSKATQYAVGKYKRQPGSVWSAVVTPERLFGWFGERGEDEWIVDTAGLSVTRVSTPDPTG